MNSSSNNTHVDVSSDLDEDDLPIPQKLRFTVDALKLLTQSPLTHDNYLHWASQIQSTLDATDYTKYLNPHTPTPPPFLITQDGHRTKNPRYPMYNLINKTLITAIRATLSPPLLSLVLRHQTLADIWCTLQSHLQSQSLSRTIQLRAELSTITMRGTDLPTYLTRVRSIHDQLEAIGCHIADAEIIILILNGLPEQFQGFVSAYSLRTEPTTLPNFYSLLTTEAINLQHRNKLHSTDPTLALATTHHHQPPTPSRNPNYKGKNPRPYYPPSTHSSTHSSTQPKPTTPNRNSTTTCQLCKKPGHIATTCRFRYHPPSSSSSTSHPKTAYISDHHTSSPLPSSPSTYTPPTQSPDTWLLDSGATAHLTNQFQNLHIPHPYTGHDSITVGNGSQLPITHTGHHTIITPNGQDHQQDYPPGDRN